MKTAIIKTNFWQEDDIFELNSDTRFFYLCLLTNPQRDITPAFKCGDRLLSAYTGYTVELINICRKQLIEKGKISYIDGYYIFNKQDFVQPSKGRDTKIIYDRYLKDLPESVVKVLNKKSTGNTTGTSTGTISSVKDKGKDKGNNKDKEKDKKDAEEISLLIESFKQVNPSYKKWFGNNTQRKSCKNLIETHGLDEVKNVIILLTQTNGRQYFPTITTPVQLEDKWAQLVTALKRYKGEKQSLQESVAF